MVRNSSTELDLAAAAKSLLTNFPVSRPAWWVSQPDADGNGNYAFFDAANYAAIFWGNYAELCSKCGIMLELLRLNSGAATVARPLFHRYATETAGP